MTGKRKKRGITPWKKTVLKFCVFGLIAAAALHGFREWKAMSFEDQREASRWSSGESCAQVSAFLPVERSLKEENIQELEYKINTSLAQDSIKLTGEEKDAKLWQDCYSGVGNLTLWAGGKSVTVEAVGTGGAFFTFHPLKLSAGSYYKSDSVMKDEILLDEETAWKLFGAFDVEGRTVRVQNMYLRISGVYKRGESSLYKEAGLPEYVVFVQYKTLLQFGGADKGTGSGSMYAPGTASSPSVKSNLRLATEGPMGAEDSDAGTMEGPPDTSSYDSGQTDEMGGEKSSTSDFSDELGDMQGDTSDDAQNMENVGTGNTDYSDTGMITTYEIVMPNPVEGYAAAIVKKAIGEESGAIVVDNTYRYGISHLAGDLRNFALLGMRTRNVRYPYWENVAIGWEMIFAALFLLECILIALVVLLLLWLLIHWYRHRVWTLARGVQSLQDSVYERQSRKKYPEYYKEKEKGGKSIDKSPSAKAAALEGSAAAAGVQKEKGRLEEKESTPFESIPQNRKAVQYETKDQDDQRSDGGSARSDYGGLR